MNKFVKAAFIASAVAASVSAAHAAGTATANFDVIVNLASACQISTAPGNITLNYSAFSAANVSGTTTFNVRCSQGLLYNVSMPISGADNIGTTLGLTYTVGVTAGGTTNVVGVAAAPGNQHTITADIGAGQPGICANTAGCSATNTYTLTISY